MQWNNFTTGCNIKNRRAYGTPSIYAHASVHLGVHHSPKVTSSLNSLYLCQEIQYLLAAFSTPTLPAVSEGSECGHVWIHVQEKILISNLEL